MNTLQNQLERLREDFREWKAIYGDPLPGYSEPQDRQKERNFFEKEIARLHTTIANAERRG